jgi:hypothetical protein
MKDNVHIQPKLLRIEVSRGQGPDDRSPAVW